MDKETSALKVIGLKFAKLIDVKSIITLAMTAAMIQLLQGNINPPVEVVALFSTSYGGMIAFFFTKKDKKEGE